MSATRRAPASASPRTVPSTTLDLLRQRRDAAGQAWITAAEHAAGERLAADLTFAGIMPKVTMDWSRGAPSDRSAGGRGLNPTEAALAARQRAEKAFAALGPEFTGLLIDLCGFDKGLELLERERNWPVRSAKVAVKLALGALARHYGYGDVATGAASARTGAWTAPGPRPRIRMPQ
jgi:Domain of unknown function (DUF6456)